MKLRIRWDAETATWVVMQGTRELYRTMDRDAAREFVTCY